MSSRPALSLFVDRRMPAQRELDAILTQLDRAAGDFIDVRKHMRQGIQRDLQQGGEAILVDAILRLRTLAASGAAQEKPAE